MGMTERAEELPTPYPSIFTDGFQVDLGEHAPGATLILIDEVGREVLRETNLPASIIRVDRGSLAAGRYTCVLIEPGSGMRSTLGAVVAQ